MIFRGRGFFRPPSALPAQNHGWLLWQHGPSRNFRAGRCFKGPPSQLSLLLEETQSKRQERTFQRLNSNPKLGILSAALGFLDFKEMSQNSLSFKSHSVVDGCLVNLCLKTNTFTDFQKFSARAVGVCAFLGVI